MFPPERQLIVHSGTIEVKGWAYSGDAHWIERVEVSPDGYARSRRSRYLSVNLI